jgi:hypothetical protein
VVLNHIKQADSTGNAYNFIWGMLVSDLGWSTDDPDRLFHDFPQSVQADVRTVSENRPHCFRSHPFWVITKWSCGIDV